MERHDTPRTGSMPGNRRIAVFAALAIAPLSLGSVATAQTRTARDTATTYGARLTAKGEPADLNPARINNRINNRLETRLGLRIERYRPNSSNDPTAAFAVRPTDNARLGTATTLSPLSTTSSSTMSQGTGATTAQTSPGRPDNDTRQR